MCDVRNIEETGLIRFASWQASLEVLFILICSKVDL